MLALAAGLTFWWVRSELETPYYALAGEEIFVEIPKGATTGRIARLLEESGIVHRTLPFEIYVRWKGLARQLQAGEYRFADSSSPIEIVRRLVRGDVYYRSVTIPEGLTAWDTIEQIHRAGLGSLQRLGEALCKTEWIRDLDPRAKTLEGYLFPETYRFPRKVAPEEIIKAMVDQFKATLAKLCSEYPEWRSRDAAMVVTLASMVEKESKSREERPLVASVFINRLAKGMPLACDPTLIYAMKVAGKYDGNIGKADLAMRSPYNTYLHSGLPPGPIANPGEDSLRAAISPARTAYMYFVSRNDGTHQFSRDFKTHQAAVARFQKNRPR
jgi:UPF0755 protein